MNLHLETAICGSCDRRWQAVFDASAEELECPTCSEMTAIAFMPELLKKPLHVIVSSFHDAIFVQVSKSVDRLHLAGLLSDALYMVNQMTCDIYRPEDEPELDVFVTVNRRRSSQDD